VAVELNVFEQRYQVVLEVLNESASLATETGECSVGVWEYKSGLAEFVRSLATDWSGFHGEREDASIEGHLTVACRHGGHGMVTCRVTIGQPRTPVWSMTADIEYGAGALLDRVAADVEQFFRTPPLTAWLRLIDDATVVSYRRGRYRAAGQVPSSTVGSEAARNGSTTSQQASAAAKVAA
jgi:hypothetical protein